jgi:ParB family chromosome partitioning protein
MSEEVVMIPISHIRILNPRCRDKKKFAGIVENIKAVGLKKPIKVSERIEGGEPGYDLICGQGRIEAFQLLGYPEIPAIVVAVSREERFLMSLIENMARRHPSVMEMISEIRRLKDLGNSNLQIAKKLGISDSLVAGYIVLHESGEERILQAILTGRIPLGVGIEIAKTEGLEMQRELLKAYESKQLNQASIRTVKRILEQRRCLGKSLTAPYEQRKRTLRTTEGMVNAFRKESQRQRAMVKKARLCEAKLLILVTAFKRLIADENFVLLLRAEGLISMPKCLAGLLHQDVREAA